MLDLLRKYAFLITYALSHPRLAVLTWRLKRSGRTFLGYWHLFSLAHNYFAVRSRNQNAPQVAEFGVGRGGSAMLLAWLVANFGGTLTLYDVFGQIPAPSHVDGARAQDRYRVITHQEGEDYYGNLPDLLDRIQREIREICGLDNIKFVVGTYEDTLPSVSSEPYDVVHIDCDWYSSVRTVLAFLHDHLSQGAILQVDDYSNWEGSRKAVDEAAWLQPYRRYLVGGPLVIDLGSHQASRETP